MIPDYVIEAMVVEAMDGPCVLVGFHDMRAALQAAEALGYRLVPVKPTKQMTEATEDIVIGYWDSSSVDSDGYGESESGPIVCEPDKAEKIWSAMIAVAPSARRA